MEREVLDLMLGTHEIPEKCIICAGTTKEEWIEKILQGFEWSRKIACRGLGCTYFVKYKGKKILLIFNVLGAPASITLTDMLIQSGARELIFIGWTGGYKNSIGEYVLPTRTYCADGITTIAKPGLEFVYPDKKLLLKIKSYFARKGIKYSEGTTFCTPSVYIFKRLEKKIRRLKPISIEMELSPYFFVSKRNKVPAAAILVVSDTEKKSPAAKANEKIRSDSQRRAIKYAAEILTRVE